MMAQSGKGTPGDLAMRVIRKLTIFLVSANIYGFRFSKCELNQRVI